MSELLEPIIEQLDRLSAELKTAISTAAPLSISSGNWSFPGITRQELGARISTLRDLVAEANDPTPESEKYLVSIAERLTFLNDHTVPQLASNANAAVSAFLITLDVVERGLAPLLTDTKALALKNSQAVKKTTIQVRSIETRLRELTPRTKSLEDMVSRIEKAYDAADQLPTDLETLAEAQNSVGELRGLAEADKGKIEELLSSIANYEKDLKAKSDEAAEVLKNCVSAYSSATSLGLAAAFSERSKALDLSMWGWVAGLVVSLIVGGLAGSIQLHRLAEELTRADASSFAISINFVLSILSVGGPVWFAWLSTKQIGQRFRLSEDYAFKASISRAYEGYRREAAQIDKNLEKQLLQSALARLDEQPLRLVESSSFGSPWHELIASDLVKDAVKTVPGFAERVLSMASTALQGKKATPDPQPAVAASNIPDEKSKEAQV